MRLNIENYSVLKLELYRINEDIEIEERNQLIIYRR